MRTAIRIIACAAALLAISQIAAAQLWWERGADKWYYKDDWKGVSVTGGSRGNATLAVTRTIEVPGGAAGGWILIWGERSYNLRVNGKQVASSVEGALIDDYELTPFVEGAEKVTLLIGGGRVCAEGEIVGRDGKRYPFATGEDWLDEGGNRVRTQKMVVRDSSGAYDTAHNGRLLWYNDEETGKSSIAKGLARIQKHGEQLVFLMRRYRPAEEVLSFSDDLPWRRAERLAAPLIEQARTILTTQAIPAQKAGRFADAIAAAQQAAILISAAEAPVVAATAIYTAQRELTHLENLSALLGKDSPLIREDLGELALLVTSARQAHAQLDWASVQKATGRLGDLSRDIRSRLESAARKSNMVGALGRLDDFPEDRFGWLNARELMGHDPAHWSFSVLPAGAQYIELNGMWSFRIDPQNVGEASGYHTAALDGGWTRIYAPKAWERQGFREDNRRAPRAPVGGRGRGGGETTTGMNKPYNGFAWYRKTLVIPAAWSGKDLVLVTGNVQNWSQIYVNGQPIAQVRQAEEQRRVIPNTVSDVPARLVKFGQENTIAIHVYNHDNFGGIVGGTLALYVKGAEPRYIETPAEMGYVKEYAFPTAQGAVRSSLVSSALSPATIVATDQPSLVVRGWEAKGYAPPQTAEYPTSAGARSVRLGESASVLESGGPAPSDSWILLRGGSTNVLLVGERAPVSATWGRDELGGMSLTLNFGDGPARVAVLSLPADAPIDFASAQAWADSLRNYPVSASQIVRAGDGAPLPQKGTLTDGPMQTCAVRYNYLKLGEPAGTKTAPVPMLLSYGLAHKYPNLALSGARPTQYRSEHATYMVFDNTDTATYRVPSVKRSAVMKGVGELFAKETAQDNHHAWGDEPGMFQRMANWGFDHCRYAFAFQADWDLPLVRSMAGPIIPDNERMWKRLDEVVNNCIASGQQMMLTWFSDTGTRRWLDRPEHRDTAYELWRLLARRYANYPEWAISYDFFNEPAQMNIDHYNQVMKELTKIIREEDKTHMIVWESGDGWAQPHWCMWMEPVDDDHVIYSFHHYGKHWGYAYDEYYPGYMSTTERTHIDPWLEALLWGIKHHQVIHCGEFGISMIQPGDDGEAWLNDYLAFFERFGIGWNWWNYSGDDIYRTGLIARDRVSPFVATMSKWMDRSGWGNYRNVGKRRDPNGPVLTTPVRQVK